MVGNRLSTRKHRLVPYGISRKLRSQCSKRGSPPFDYIVCTTKNLPGISPSLSTAIRPAGTLGHTVLVLQNGLNIGKPLIKAFPHNIVLTGVSMINSHEAEPGRVIMNSLTTSTPARSRISTYRLTCNVPPRRTSSECTT